MSKNKNSRIGLGNIISLFGLALMGFFTFAGALMLTAGNMGASIGIAAAVVVVLALLLNAAIYCKKQDTDFAKWKKLEIATVIVFFIAAVFPTRYVMHFFDVVTSKEELQKAATEDATKIKTMFRNYEDGELSALAVTTTGLQNALGEQCDINVNEYLSAASIKNYEDIDAWILVERRMLLGDMGVEGGAPYINYKHNVDSVVNDWVGDVKSWNLLKIGRQAKMAGELAPAVAKELTNRSAMAKLPVIIYDNDTYIINGNNQTITITEPKLDFEKKLTTPSGLNLLFMIVYIIIVAIIALQYILTPRSEKTEISEGKTILNDNGVNIL